VLRWLLLPLVLVAAIAAVLLASGGGDGEPPPPPKPPAAERPAGLDEHLAALQRIADENGGTRAAGSPGDRATADYIEGRLRAAGYRVARQRFDVPFYARARRRG
jgi:hypothetical protein